MGLFLATRSVSLCPSQVTAERTTAASLGESENRPGESSKNGIGFFHEKTAKRFGPRSDSSPRLK